MRLTRDALCTGIIHEGRRHQITALAVWSEEEIRLQPGCGQFKASSPRMVYLGQRREYIQAQTVVRTLLMYPPFMDTGDENDFTYDSVYDHILNKLHSIEQPLTASDAHRLQFITTMKTLRFSVLRVHTVCPLRTHRNSAHRFPLRFPITRSVFHLIYGFEL